MSDDLAPALERLRQAATGLPGVVEGTSYGTPALKIGKTMFCRVKDARTVVLMCPVEDKEMLIEQAPSVFFQTDHYKGWPAVLVHLDAISDSELRHRLEMAWRARASKRLVAEWERRHSL